MSIVYCKYCHKDIDTDFDAEHFDDNENCLLELEELKFPVFLKNDVFCHRLLSKTACQTITKPTDGLSEFGVSMSDFGPQMEHHVYVNYLKGEYEQITEGEFAFAELNMKNAMSRKIMEYKPKKSIV